MRGVRRRSAVFVASLAVAAIVVACGGDNDDGVPPADTATPVPVTGSVVPHFVVTPAPAEVLVTDTAMGRILTDAGGFTLYTFSDDTPRGSTSVCNGVCAQVWPPFVVDAGAEVAAPAEVQGDLSTFTRRDGTTQVSYNGMPVYRFLNDLVPGDVNGDGFGGKWFVVQP